MRRSHTISSLNTTELDGSDFWQRSEGYPVLFVEKDKEVKFLVDSEGDPQLSNPDSLDYSDLRSTQRPSISSTRSESPDSRRSSTPGWLQRGRQDLRLFELQKKVAQELRREENAREASTELQQPRRPTFTDFTQSQSDRPKEDSSSAETSSKSPLLTTQVPKHSAQKGPSSTLSRKPEMTLASIPTPSFCEPDYTKTPKLELAQFLKVFTPGRSPRSRTPNREAVDEPVNYLNIKPTGGILRDDASNSSVGSPAKERTSWLNRFSIHRKASPSPSRGKSRPQSQSANSEDENSESVDTVMRGRIERPPLKTRFAPDSFFRSSTSHNLKGHTGDSFTNISATKPPGLVPTGALPGVTKGPHYLPSEARRVNTPPIHTAGGKLKGYFWNFADDNTEEDTGASTSDSFQQPFPMPLDAEGAGRRRPSVAPSEEKDWYRVRLDEILDEGEIDEKLMKQELSTMEWSVPEHLPGSPLCPLSPKYKGKVNSICVYHGRKAALD